MGYLNKATITVDAILTNRGRELLAEGGSGATGLQIVKFAVADDEIDYGLYTDNHPTGIRGALIENLPVLEATPDEQQIMRYKLVSFDKIKVGNNSPFVDENGRLTAPRILNIIDRTISLTGASTSVGFTPTTSPSYSERYTLIVANGELFNIYAGQTTTGTPLNTQNAVAANGSFTYTFNAGQQITFSARSGVLPSSTTYTVFGQDTGATASAIVTVTA